MEEEESVMLSAERWAVAFVFSRGFCFGMVLLWSGGNGCVIGWVGSVDEEISGGCLEIE